jgi:hypothetical protein
MTARREPKTNPKTKPARGRGLRADLVIIDEPFAHPGVLAAGGHPDPGDCAHPKGRRDGKNPRLCRACGGPVPDGVK